MNETLPNACYRLSLRALVLDETRTKFLATLNKSGKWSTPGGGLDHGELPQAGVLREIKEEMGLEATYISSSPVYFSTGLREDNIWAAFAYYEVRLKNLDFTPSDECKEMRFVTREEAQKMNFYESLKGFINEFDPKRHLI